MAKIRISPGVAGWLIALVTKILGLTLRFRVDDRAGVLADENSPKGMIWLAWHNRILLSMVFFWRFCGRRKGAVLTSASRDGEIFAQTCRHLGYGAARGSSTRRRLAAVRESLSLLAAGYNLGVTPDGPRGPRYHLQPGVLLLAQKSEAPVLPIFFRTQSCWRLKTWDGFVIPKPFSRVDVILGPFLQLRPIETAEDFEAERLRLEQTLRAGTEEK
ncbi:MAG: lysophospholipid acyltransferase family protein [Verrucomicrobiales bacterium]